METVQDGHQTKRKLKANGIISVVLTANLLAAIFTIYIHNIFMLGRVIVCTDIFYMIFFRNAQENPAGFPNALWKKVYLSDGSAQKNARAATLS